MPDLLSSLRRAGLSATEVVGSGMEGTVVALADGTVAKLWHTRSRAELEVLQEFHAAVAAAGLPFAVPEVRAVVDVGDRVATVMPRLPGTPLWDRPGTSPPLDARLADALVAVLSGLAAAPVSPAMALLPVLDGEQPFPFDVPFGSSLAALAHSRIARSASVLRSRVAGLDDLVGAVTSCLRTLSVDRPALVHGDLVPGNVLLVGDRVSAVLDLGFLTTVGDPAFDAAVAASVADMYGPHARRTEAFLDRVLQDALGHDPSRTALYRLAYALVTATCYSASGSDGHFAWCAAQLGRPDLREAALAA